MHQRRLLKETKQFLMPSEKAKTGIKIHERYAGRIRVVSLILISGVLIHLFLFGVELATAFGVIMLLGGIVFELLLRVHYKFDGRTAVKYYALQIYEEPNEKTLRQLHSWNKNPFDLTTEYYYPLIGDLIEKASNHDNPAEYVHEEIPDVLRLIERNENTDYNSIVNISSIDEYDLNPYYINLLQELNYTYKFGAYTSASILSRKISESLLRDILFAKGIYENLPEEPTFEQKIDLFKSEVLDGSFQDDTVQELSVGLDKWIRKKGNKGAHLSEEFTRAEIEELMDYARKSIRLLIVIREQAVTEKEQNS